MKALVTLLLTAIALVILFGSPLAAEKPAKARHYGSPVPILPMTFGHGDHITVNCLDCHHTYRDGSGGQPCMACHVQHAELGPLLRRQFHRLCRGCHEERAARGEPAGPPRHCSGCHLGDEQAWQAYALPAYAASAVARDSATNTSDLRLILSGTLDYYSG